MLGSVATAVVFAGARSPKRKTMKRSSRSTTLSRSRRTPCGLSNETIADRVSNDSGGGWRFRVGMFGARRRYRPGGRRPISLVPRATLEKSLVSRGKGFGLGYERLSHLVLRLLPPGQRAVPGRHSQRCLGRRQSSGAASNQLRPVAVRDHSLVRLAWRCPGTRAWVQNCYILRWFKTMTSARWRVVQPHAGGIG